MIICDIITQLNTSLSFYCLKYLYYKIVRSVCVFVCVCDRYFLGNGKCYRRDSFSPILLSSAPRSSLLSKFENAIFNLFLSKLYV
ncbi:hypothetical protein WDU94_002484 [Cyamophila willieti]